MRDDDDTMPPEATAVAQDALADELAWMQRPSGGAVLAAFPRLAVALKVFATTSGQCERRRNQSSRRKRRPYLSAHRPYCARAPRQDRQRWRSSP